MHARQTGLPNPRRELKTMNASSRRVAIVTGASRGIGAATAIALAQRGISPVLAVRQPQSAETTRRAVLALGLPCTVVACDITQQDQVLALVASTLEEYGRLDAVINNAGQIGPIGHVADVAGESWRANFETNLFGPYRLVQAALQALRETRGTALQLSSGAAHTPREGWSAYCSAKAALAMFSRCVGHEYAGDGVRVYSVQPGVVDTDMQVQIRASGMNEISRIPRENLAPPDVSARLIAWLVDTQPADLSGAELGVHDASLLERAGITTAQANSHTPRSIP